jgi:uncharacterized protein (DUF1778 family)
MDTKMGRPPKDGVTKAERVELRADADEVAAWDRAAERAKLSRSDWVRVTLNSAARRQARKPS